MSAQPHPNPEEQPGKIPVAEYFEMRRKSDVRLEYVDGEIIAMAGGSVPHNRIAKNITVALENRFDTSRCEAFVENMGVRTASNQYRYPDVVALCGEPEIDMANPPNLLNPQVIFEVLSLSTAEFDSGAKFDEYRQIPTLMDYVTISQQKIHISHFARQSPAQWILTDYTRPDDVIVLAPLNVSLTLVEIYRRVQFDTQSASPRA